MIRPSLDTKVLLSYRHIIRVSVEGSKKLNTNFVIMYRWLYSTIRDGVLQHHPVVQKQKQLRFVVLNYYQNERADDGIRTSVVEFLSVISHDSTVVGVSTVSLARRTPTLRKHMLCRMYATLARPLQLSVYLFRVFYRRSSTETSLDVLETQLIYCTSQKYF